MKRVIRSFSTLLLIASLAQVANAGGNPVSATVEVRKEISRLISYPGSLKPTHDVEVVLVSFRIESCGMITVLESNASNQEFRNYVIRKLEGMRFESSGEEVHHMRFVFRATAS